MPEDSKNLRLFGDRLRELRLNAGWSQEDFAERAQLHRTYGVEGENDGWMRLGFTECGTEIKVEAALEDADMTFGILRPEGGHWGWFNNPSTGSDTRAQLTIAKRLALPLSASPLHPAFQQQKPSYARASQFQHHLPPFHVLACFGPSRRSQLRTFQRTGCGLAQYQRPLTELLFFGLRMACNLAGRNPGCVEIRGRTRFFLGGCLRGPRRNSRAFQGHRYRVLL